VQLSDGPLLRLRSASFGYAHRRVVSEVDLELREGEVVALLGPNGSGKSTLVRGILGLTPLQGGSVELFGVPRDRFTEHTRIGYVPQRHSLSASVRATVTEIVEVGRLPHRPWWRPASRHDRTIVREAIRDVGLADRSGEEVASLSGGQQRRVLIARALAGQPEVLVMDEPTAGVDQVSQEALTAVLRRLADRGTSMLVVTHELAALEAVVSRIVCLDAGHVDFDGTPASYALHLAGHAVGSDHHHPDDSPPRRGHVIGAAPLDPFPREAPP
jgi:zinc transport system ATP-binding protein